MTQNAHNGRQKRPPRAVFLATTIVFFVLSLSAADSIGFVPCDIDGTCAAGQAVTESIPLSDLPQLGLSTSSRQANEPPVVIGVEPDRLVIPSVNIDLPVQNPSTRDIQTLDDLLQKGPVRYVDSAKLGEKGNVLIFAHTSHLPVVHNQMYRAFNRVPDLKPGDSITVEGGGQSYLYTVTSVRRADASDAVVDLSPTQGTKLTLVTCDTLTGKSARWILTADFVGQL